MNIRVARREDVPDIVKVVNEAYRASAGWTNESKLIRGERVGPDKVQSLLEDSHSKLVVYVDEHDTLIGTCLLRKGDQGEVEAGMIAIEVSAQNKGHGRALLAAVEAFACDTWTDQVHRLELSVIEQRTELISWYERLGFERSAGVVIPFPYDDPSIGIPLREDLRFVQLVKNLSCKHA